MEAPPFKLSLTFRSQAFVAGQTPTGQQLAATNQNGAQYMIHNTSGSDVVFLGVSTVSAALAVTNAVASTTDGQVCGYPIGPGMKEMITIANDASNANPLWFAFRTVAAVTPVVYVTTGTGQ